MLLDSPLQKFILFRLDQYIRDCVWLLASDPFNVELSKTVTWFSQLQKKLYTYSIYWSIINLLCKMVRRASEINNH